MEVLRREVGGDDKSGEVAFDPQRAGASDRPTFGEILVKLA